MMASKYDKTPIDKVPLDYLQATAKAIDEKEAARERLDNSQKSHERLKKAKKRSDYLIENEDELTNRTMYGMKNGGKVSSASTRADGIAERGKTKGRML
jgi:hypothetical protein